MEQTWKSVNYGEWIKLTRRTGTRSMARISPRYNCWGHLVNYIYKAPPLWIDYRLCNGKTKSYRLNGLHSSIGFYIHPETFSIFKGFKGGTRTRAFRVRSSWEWGVREEF
jgi:hypothetical protein